jgi:alkyl sulfatase BDS1-like metallo-beta-lactamase superfamily hydrolase
MSRATLDAISLHQTSFPAAARAGLIQIDGDIEKLVDFMHLLDTFTPDFPIVTPRPAEN